MQTKMISEEQQYKNQLDQKPSPCIAEQSLVPVSQKHYPGTKDQGKNSGWPGDAEPKPPDHDGELTLKYGSFRLLLFIGFRIINKQPYDIKHSCKPGNDEDDMEGFEVKIH